MCNRKGRLIVVYITLIGMQRPFSHSQPSVLDMLLYFPARLAPQHLCWPPSLDQSRREKTSVSPSSSILEASPQALCQWLVPGETMWEWNFLYHKSSTEIVVRPLTAVSEQPIKKDFSFTFPQRSCSADQRARGLSVPAGDWSTEFPIFVFQFFYGEVIT